MYNIIHMNKQAINRLKSFAWRTAMMVVAFLATWGIEVIASVNIDPATKTVIGLILGEISKFLNTELSKN